jgi:homoserine O-succinyltransferase
VPKHQLERKMFGIFRHHIVNHGSSLLRGFNDEFSIPVSRHTEVRREDIPDKPGLRILAESPEAGICLMEDLEHRALYMFNHLEYDADTLKREYERDVASGAEIQVPKNYFPEDDPSQQPGNQWRAYAHLLFWNWIYEIYEHTPFNISKIGDTGETPLEQTGS